MYQDLMTLKLDGRVALVTGSSRGIGRAIALAFAKEGADVVVNSRINKQLAEEVVTEIVKLGRKAIAVQADVRNLEEVQNLVTTAIKEFGKVDILVNNAGINIDRTLKKMLPDDWTNVISTDLTGVFYCSKTVLEHMVLAGKGRIISISSIVGQMGNFGQTNYAAAKAGVIGFTKSLAKEVAKNGITVNAIAPGFTETDMLARVDDARKQEILKHIPMGRFGKAEDIAELAVFLASDDASYITGQVININGGMYT